LGYFCFQFINHFHQCGLHDGIDPWFRGRRRQGIRRRRGCWLEGGFRSEGIEGGFRRRLGYFENRFRRRFGSFRNPFGFGGVEINGFEHCGFRGRFCDWRRCGFRWLRFGHAGKIGFIVRRSGGHRFRFTGRGWPCGLMGGFGCRFQMGF
jgi:hypothetical protein